MSALPAETSSLANFQPNSPFFFVHSATVSLIKLGGSLLEYLFNFFSLELPGLAGALISAFLLFFVLRKSTEAIHGLKATNHLYQIENAETSDPWVGEMPPEARDILDAFELPESLSFQASVPRGVLLIGPPGTGKTHFARTLARIAGCSFFTCCASEFDDTYVGVGASNVRRIFDEAAASCQPTYIQTLQSWYHNTPLPPKKAIIFIDELDAIGQRSTHLDGSASATNQTITQLLTCLSGMRSNPNILVLAASNHIESLDSAILRSGRFDRIITIGLPNEKSRMELLWHYLPDQHEISESELEPFAEATHNFSSADMQNLVEEAKRYLERDLIARWKATGETPDRANSSRLKVDHLTQGLNALRKHKELECKKDRQKVHHHVWQFTGS